MTIDWDIIIETIEAEKCILCVGPEIFTDAAGEKLDFQIAKMFQNDNLYKSYYPNDGLFLFNNEESKTLFYYKLKKYYEGKSADIEGIINKLIKIPFNLIVNLNSDNILLNTATNSNYKFNSDFYWKNRTPTSKNISPTKSSPLVYNLFGSVLERDSLVLTYQDLFDYFDSILGARSMPTELKQIISNADNFIFLGVHFEKWYMQLMLRILSKYNNKNSFLRYASNMEIDDQIAVFCKEQFRITFVKENIEEFVDNLFEKCNERGICREATSEPAIKIATIHQQIVNGDMNSAIEGIGSLLKIYPELEEDIYNEYILLQERYNRLNRRIRNQIINDNDAEVGKNIITKSILGLLMDIKNEYSIG